MKKAQRAEVMQEQEPNVGGSHRLSYFLLFLGMILLINILSSMERPIQAAGAEDVSSFVVQAVDLETAVTAVETVGGTVTHKLSIINAVGAQLTPEQKEFVEQMEGVSQVFADGFVQTFGGKDTTHPT